MSFDHQKLIKIFNQTFQTTEQTILVSGGSEPLYLPKNEQCPFHQIIFTHDYFASALHEIAHWCLASIARRQLIDYGYWYNPDGRTVEEQRLFEQVEIKPQALEWIFADTVNFPFQISADNVANGNQISAHFQKNVQQQKQLYLERGLPKRAVLFKEALLNSY